MKKAATILGVSAMVLTLGLGSSFAQQQGTPKTEQAQTVVQPKAVDPAAAEKDSAVKPGTKTEQANPAAVKTSEKSTQKVADKASAPPTATGTKTDKGQLITSEKPAATDADVKDGAIKPSIGAVKADKEETLKGTPEANTDKVEPAKGVAPAVKESKEAPKPAPKQ